MADGATVNSVPDRPRSLVARSLGGLRFMVADRMGLLILIWAAVALVLRPMMVEAHLHQKGPLLGLYTAIDDTLAFARLTGLVQWLSLSLLIIVAALAHTRLTVPQAGRTSVFSAMDRGLADFAVAAFYALLFCVGYLAFVWTPTTTFTIISHDSFIFFDAIYRINHGERPHIDFPTALGAATMYLPVLGAALSGGYAGAIEIISAPLALLLCLACAHAGMRRYPTGVSATLVALVFFAVVPAVLLGLRGSVSQTFINQEPVTLTEDLTHAMFYNRWGWGALIPIFAYLAPRQPASSQNSASRGWLFDTLVMASLLTFLFYLKITFFVIGVAGAGVYALVNERPIRTLLYGAGVTLGLVLLIGLPTGLLVPYIENLAFVANISAGKANTLFSIMRVNMVLILLACVPLGVVGVLGRLAWRDWTIGSFMLLASIYTILQNAQLLDILTLVSLAAYGLTRVWDEKDRVARYAALTAFILTAVAPIMERSIGLLEQAISTRREEIRPPAAWSSIPALRRVYIPEREDGFSRILKAKNPDELHKAFHLSNRIDRKETMRQGEYMVTLLAGIKELQAVMRPGDSIAALDMANPFPFLMNARSAKGSYITLDAGRTMSKDHYPAPEIMFADADHVMIAKASLIQRTVELSEELYDDWLTAHYEERVETMYWIRYSRRKAQ